MNTCLLAFALVPMLASVVGPTILGNQAPFNPKELDRAEVRLRVLTPGPHLPRLPILLSVEITNPTAEDLDLPAPTLSSRDNPFNTLDVLVGKDGTVSRVRYAVPTFTPWKEGVPPERPEIMRLRPRQTVTVLLPFSYDWVPNRPELLVAPGKLTLAARLCSLEKDKQQRYDVRRDQGKTSNEVVIEVTSPAGDDVKALAAVEALKHPWLLAAPQAAELWALGMDPATLAELVKTYPRSPYALYAKAALACLLASGDVGLPAAQRQTNPARAIQLFDEVLRDKHFALPAEVKPLNDKLRAANGLKP